MPITEIVGGAYHVLDCSCGARFCCGDIARRVLANKPKDYDIYFLSRGVPDPKALRINLVFLRLANDRYAKRKSAEKNIKKMCMNIMNGEEPTVGMENIAECSRYLNIDSCCVSMNVKSVCVD